MATNFTETPLKPSKGARYSVDFFAMSCIISLVILATVLSFPQYFIYVPFTNGLNTLSFLGFFALLGWTLLMIVPPLALNPKIKIWRVSHTFLLLVAVLIYPVSTLGVKIVGLVSLQQFWIQYLVTYPILFVVEWIFPLIYIGIAVSLSRRHP